MAVQKNIEQECFEFISFLKKYFECSKLRVTVRQKCFRKNVSKKYHLKKIFSKYCKWSKLRVVVRQQQ